MKIIVLSCCRKLPSTLSCALARPLWAVAAALLLALGANPSARADNLLTNGDFETGSLAGWTVQGPFIGVQGGGYSGNFSLYCGSGMNDNGSVGDRLSQTFATVPGESYDLSIWAFGQVNGGLGEVYFDWNQTRALDLSNPDFVGWTELRVSVTATDSQSTFVFGSRNNPSAYLFDNASVSPTVVPEPSIAALAAFSFACLLLIRHPGRSAGF
jgi:hypothetical protein